METERMLNELIAIKEKEKGKQYSTFSLNIYDMVTDIIPKIDKLNKIEEIERKLKMPIIDYVKIVTSNSITIYEIGYTQLPAFIISDNYEYSCSAVDETGVSIDVYDKDLNTYGFDAERYKKDWFITEKDAVERFSFLVDEYKNSIKDIE